MEPERIAELLWRGAARPGRDRFQHREDAAPGMKLVGPPSCAGPVGAIILHPPHWRISLLIEDKILTNDKWQNSIMNYEKRFNIILKGSNFTYRNRRACRYDLVSSN